MANDTTDQVLPLSQHEIKEIQQKKAKENTLVEALFEQALERQLRGEGQAVPLWR